MKFEHNAMVFESTNVQDALEAMRSFGYLPVQFMSEVESGNASAALIRLYEQVTSTDPKQVMLNNFTQHAATTDQQDAGVVDLSDDLKAKVQKLLTFDRLPQSNLMAARAADLADIAVSLGATHAMIGGAPFFMGYLERALKEQGVQPLYAFSRRVVTEEAQPDGSVKKVAIFKHEGFVPA